MGSLHQWILFFSPKDTNSAPYAFVSLRHTAVKELDSASKRIVLASTTDTGWPLRTSDDGWLELCLLLGDGRFQPLEAPQLELRLGQAANFDAWASHLVQICHDEKTPRS